MVALLPFSKPTQTLFILFLTTFQFPVTAANGWRMQPPLAILSPLQSPPEKMGHGQRRYTLGGQEGKIADRWRGQWLQNGRVAGGGHMQCPPSNGLASWTSHALPLQLSHAWLVHATDGRRGRTIWQHGCYRHCNIHKKQIIIAAEKNTHM